MSLMTDMLRQSIANSGVSVRVGDSRNLAPSKDEGTRSDDDNAWKYISAGDFSGLNDYTDREYDYRKIPFLGQFLGHTVDAATQGIADLAQFAGLESVGNFLNEKAQEGEAQLPPMSEPRLSLDYVTDPNGLTSAAGMMTGSMLSIAPAAAIIPEGAVAAAAGFASKAPKIGGLLSKILSGPLGAVRWGATGPVEAMMEGGGAEREMLENGASREDAKQAAWDVFKGNAAFLAASNALQAGLLGKVKVPVPKSSNAVLNSVGNIFGYAPATMAEMASQGYEEGVQQGIQNSAMGRAEDSAAQIFNPLDWTDDQWYAAKMGMAGAVPLVGGAAAMRQLQGAFSGANEEEEAPVQNNAPTLTSGNSDIDAEINAAAAKYNLPADLVYAVAQTESDFDQSSLSSVGAIGVMQLMPDTAKALGVDPHDRAQNIEGGAKYLRQLLDTFDGDVTKALAAYNAGPQAVKDHGGVPPYEETQNYVAKIMGILDGANMNPATEVEPAHSLLDDAEPFIGTRMVNGKKGCVEAVTKIGAAGSDFLRAELDAGVVNVDRLVADAGDRVIPFDPSKLEEGDVIVYGDDTDSQQHVVLYDGKGGYIGNSSDLKLVVHRNDYNAMGSLYPTKIIKSGGRYGGTVNISSVSGSVRPIDYSGLVVDAKNLQANAAAMKALIEGDKLTPAQKAAIIDAAEIIRDTPTEASAASPAEDALDYNAWQRLIDHKDVKGIFDKDPERVTRMVMRGEETQRKAQTVAAIENQQKVAQAQSVQAQVQAAAQAQPVANPAESAARLASVQQELSLPPMAQQEIAARLASYAQTTPHDVERVVIQNGLAHGDFTGIARALPEVYRAAAGRWMQQPQEQAQPQPQTQPPQPTAMPAQQDMQMPNVQANDVAVPPSQEMTAQMPQQMQGQAQAVPTTEDLADIRQKLSALDAMMQGNPTYVEARRRGDWQTAAQEAAKAGHHDFARFYQMLHEKATGVPINITPYQNPAEKAAAEQSAVRPTPAPVPINHVDSMRPIDIPKSYGARRDFGRGLIKAMRMRNLLDVRALNDDLRKGEKRAIEHALKRIAQVDAEDALLRGETAAQRANDNETVQAESRKKQDNDVRAESAQKQGKEKAADEGGATVEENIARGMRAMQKVIETHEDVRHAMHRDDTGAIDFVWGFAGKGEKLKQGYGVAHILAKHVPESGESLPYKIVETIAKGKIVQKKTTGGSTQPRLVLEHDGYVALFSIGGNNNAWLLSGWEKYDSIQKRASIANGEGDGSTAATATAPMRSRRDGEDALSPASNIPSEQEKSKEKSVQAKSAPLTKQEQEALTGTSEEAKEAYRVVRDKLASSKNKAVARAAKVGATLFARHADIYAKAYSKATGKPYTALDYMHDRFGLDVDGTEVEANADGLKQSAPNRENLSDAERKDLQFRIIQEMNPMRDDIHTGVRSPKDILAAKEAFQSKTDEDSYAYPDFTNADGIAALKRGSVTVYSSHPILPGAFVTPSRMQAKDYAGGGKVYSAQVPIEDVAWLHSDEGQYAPLEWNGFDQRAWHGSPHKFKKFDLGAIGTGEGAQVHGWGLYFAQQKSVGKGYREGLTGGKWRVSHGDEVYEFDYDTGDLIHEGTGSLMSNDDPETLAIEAFIGSNADKYEALNILENALEDKRRMFFPGEALDEEVGRIEDAIELLENEWSRFDVEPSGSLFQVEIPDNDVLLDEQLPFNKQPEKVQEALKRIAGEMRSAEEGSPEVEFAENYRKMNGKKIYEALTHITSDYEDASRLLNNHGIKGITYDGQRDGRCFVIFDDEAIEIIEEFNQRMNSIRKGSITPQASGRRIISLFEQADESTFLHEMGHMFLMDLEDIAALDEASAEDLETVRDWATWQEGQAKEYEDTPWQKEFAEREKAILAAKKRGDVVEVRKLRREWEQERFARGFERYLETGKAPTSVLKRIFLKFKKFLERIYQAFKGTGGKASPEVEAVMGRMIAEEEQAANSEFGENPVQEKSAPIPTDFSASKLKGAIGKTASIATDSGEEIPVRYRLVEAKSLITSNSAKDFTRNPRYPKTLQPRDRERANMQQQIREMASRLRPEDLAASRSVNLGAPVVRADGVVLNGNGRAIAITRALLGNTFRDSTGKGYRAFLVEHAEEFGFKPETVQRMKAPMLVREVTGGLTAEQVKAVTTSTAGGSRLGASEQAKQDAEKITLEDLARYEENDRGDLTTAANRDFVAGILYRVSGKNDVNAYTDAKGQVNADGIQRVKRALFAKAYGDDDLLSRMSESTDDDTRNITNGLTNAAPYIARANEKMARGTAHSYNVGETIANAVKRYNYLHNIGQSVESYLDQQAMFAEYEDSPEVREVLRVLNENRRSGKRIAQFVRRIGEIAEAQGNPNEISLMEGGEPLSLHDVIRSAKEGLQEAPGQQSLDTLFQRDPVLKQAALSYGATEQAGKVEFKNPGREKEFLRIADALQGDVAKKLSASKSDSRDMKIDASTLVSPKNLTEQQRSIVDFGKKMGVSVAFFRDKKSSHGALSENGVVFINVDSKTSLRWTFWHEALHWMKANNEGLFWDIIRDVEQAGVFTKAQLNGYRKAIGAPELSDADVIEEMLADALLDVKRRVPLLKDLGKRNRSLAERFVGWIRDVMDKFRDHFAKPGVGLTKAQSTAMRNAFAALARDMVDERGRRIFRVNEFSRRITLANGSPLPSAKYSLDNREGRGDNEDKISKAVFDKHLNDGIMKMVEERVHKEIGEHVDFAVMSDPVARDAARDGLPYIKKILTQYNIIKAQKMNPAYADRYAVMIEYARRCFDNDSRIGREAARSLGQDDGQGRMDSTGNENHAETNVGRSAERGGRSALGLSRSVSGEKSGARKHFEKLYEDMKKHPETGAFSMVKFSRDNRKPGSEGLFRKLLVALKLGEAAEKNLEVHRSNKEKQLVISASKLNQFMADKSLTEKNILKTEDLGGGKIRVTYMPQDFHNIHILDWVKSVRQLRKKNPFVKAIYDLGSRAMRLQEHLRNEGAKTVKGFRELTKNKNDHKLVSSILLEGDAAGKEYGVQELRAMGANANVIKAYQLVRRTMREWYKRVNDARMQVETRTKTLSKNDLADFKKNHWIADSDVLSVEEKGDGKVLLTWRGGKTYETKDKVMTKTELDTLLQDKDINVAHVHKLNDSYGVDNYSVDYVERIKPLGNLTGYMPHFFHEWMVYEKHKDPKTGEVRLTTIGSGRSMNDAVRLGNEIARKNSDKEYVVRPKGFDLNVENSVVIGDADFQQMAAKLADETQMTLADANAFLRDSAGATMRARHRFFGNAMHRKGAKGFDTDITYVLTHYLNTSARYIAMEQFKPRAITLYERWFGAFDADPKDATASYVKGLIKDINGDPRPLEKSVSELIMKTPIGKIISDAYGDRAALSVNGELSTWNAISKLGLGNFASMAVNFSQFINIGAAMNDYGYAAKGFRSALHPTAADVKILEESGVLDEINQAADNGGYTQRRFGRVGSVYGAIKRGGELSLLPFQYADVLMRKTAILGAYKQGVEKLGLSHEEAMERARDINYDANFDYSAANAPLMIRAGSVVTQQMFQFQKYPIMQMEFMYNILKNGTRGQKVRFLLPYVLMCGIPGTIPFGAIFNQIFSFLFHLATGDDKDIGDEIKAEALRWAGKDPVKKAIVNASIYGVLAPVFGIDVSKRIGISGAFSGEFFGAQKPESVLDVLGMQLGGPMASTAVNMANQLHNGNPIEALKAFSPALGNMAQAMVGVSRTTRHRVKSRYEATYDRIIHAMGFRSVDESNNSFITSYEFDRKDAETHAKQEAIMDYLDDPSEANRQRINALGIKDKAIEEARIQQERSATERAKGGRPKVESGKTSKRRTSHKRKEDKPKKETLFDTIGEEDEGM